MGQGSQTPTPAEGADNRTRTLRGSLAFQRAGEIAQLVEHTTENRGVPGSSPGLAIARKPRWMLDLAVSGVSSAIRKKGMKRGRPAEPLAIPRNSWSADAAVNARRMGVCTLEPKTPRLPSALVVSPLRFATRGTWSVGVPRLRGARLSRQCWRPATRRATHKPLHRQPVGCARRGPDSPRYSRHEHGQLHADPGRVRGVPARGLRRAEVV